MHLLLHLFVFLLNGEDTTTNFISSPSTLQQLCFKVGASELLNHRRQEFDWAAYFLTKKQHAYEGRFETALAFTKKNKEKVLYPSSWINNCISCCLNEIIEKKYFPEENIVITKFATMNWKLSALCCISGLIICDFAFPLNIYIWLMPFRYYGIYDKKHAHSHLLTIDHVLNNNTYTTTSIFINRYSESPENTNICISKNYQNDNQICVLGNDFIDYINTKTKSASTLHFSESFQKTMQEFYGNSKENIVFIDAKTNNDPHNLILQCVLFNLHANKQLKLVALFYQDGSSKHREFTINHVESYFTTKATYIIAANNNKIAIFAFDQNKALYRLPGEIDATFVHMDEDAKYIMYWKNGILYKQFFDESQGIADKKSDLFYDSQEIICSRELPFIAPTFTLLRASRDQSLLTFKVTEKSDLSKKMECAIAIHVHKKVLFFLNHEEIKMLHNFRYDIENLDEVIQEKINDPEKIINLYKTKDRLLIVDRVKRNFQNRRVLS